MFGSLSPDVFPEWLGFFSVWNFHLFMSWTKSPHKTSSDYSQTACSVGVALLYPLSSWFPLLLLLVFASVLLALVGILSFWCYIYSLISFSFCHYTSYSLLRLLMSFCNSSTFFISLLFHGGSLYFLRFFTIFCVTTSALKKNMYHLAQWFSWRGDTQSPHLSSQITKCSRVWCSVTFLWSTAAHLFALQST